MRMKTENIRFADTCFCFSSQILDSFWKEESFGTTLKLKNKIGIFYLLSQLGGTHTHTHT